MIRPINDWILLKLDPVEERLGSIILPIGSCYRKATVLATGPGRELPSGVRQPTDVQVGDRVVYSRAHEEHKSGERLLQMLGKGMFLVKPNDILFVMTEEVSVS